jgi:hypothetical protein
MPRPIYKSYGFAVGCCTIKQMAKNTGPKTKTPQKPPRNYRLLLLTSAGFMLAVLAMVFVFRGWVRVTLVPRTAGLFYAHAIQEATDQQTIPAGAFPQLGYASVEVMKAACKNSIAKGIKQELLCVSQKHAYVVMPTNETEKQLIVKNAQDLHDWLLAHGWTVGQNTDLNKLVNSVLYGNGANPDAYYEKHIGDITCTFDSNAAFAQPKPPAMASNLACYRVFHVFGDPWKGINY